MGFVKNNLVLICAILIAVGGVFAAEGLGLVGCAAGCMCAQLMSILPVVAMLMVIGAGVVYAAGQMMGAETRARANTWATAMLIGAVIGILIVVVAPSILDILYTTDSGGTGTEFSGYSKGICNDPPTIGGTPCGSCSGA